MKKNENKFVLLKLILLLCKIIKNNKTMEAFDNELNAELESHNTKKCRFCGYTGEQWEFSPECPICEKIDDEDNDED